MLPCPSLPHIEPFRVGIHDFSHSFRLTLSGALTAREADGVEARWRTAASIIGGRIFEVDLREVSSADAPARELLRRMHQSGARFLAKGEESRRLVLEITGVDVGSDPAVEAPAERPRFGRLASRISCLVWNLWAWSLHALRISPSNLSS
jgi:hypothetical protein